MRAVAVTSFALAVVVAGCRTEGEPGDGRGAVTSPGPSAPATQEPPPKVGIKKAFRKMQIAFRRRDARSAMRLMTPRTVRYLKATQRHVATAGRPKIESLSVWQKLVLTTLRTDHHEDLVGALSPEAFLDYVFGYDLDHFPTARLRTKSIEVRSASTAAAAVGSTAVRFKRVDGEWRVDCRGAFEAVSVTTKRSARRAGQTTEEAIFRLAEDATTGLVSPDVWDRPE